MVCGVCGLLWGVCGLGFAALLLKLYYQATSGWCPSKRRMDGKTVIVTGANTGIGKETALELAKRGARLILACRDQQRGEQARDEIIRQSGNRNVELMLLDLGSLDSVRRFAAEFRKREGKLHVLVNNAAAVGLPNKLSKDGLQQEMQINHFGPMLLTLLLIDLLKASAPSRVIMVSSLAHKYARLELDNINSERKWHSGMTNYANAKLANVLFSNELARRLHGTGVTSNSVHPGVVQTEIARRAPSIFTTPYNTMVGFLFKNAEAGAQTSIYLAVAEEMENITGKYYVDCKEEQTAALARDEKFAKDFWDKSISMVKLEPSELNL